MILGAIAIGFAVSSGGGAEIGPVQSGRRASISRRDLIALIVKHQADPALRETLDELAGETTDDLGPLR